MPFGLPLIIIYKTKRGITKHLPANSGRAVFYRHFRQAKNTLKEQKEGKIKWPLNEEVYLVIYELDSNYEIKAGKVEKHVFTETGNQIETTLEKMTKEDLNEKLKHLNING